MFIFSVLDQPECGILGLQFKFAYTKVRNEMMSKECNYEMAVER